MNDEIEIQLPNGELLLARAIADSEYPSVSVFLKHGDNNSELICFAEFNPEHKDDHRICIGVYNDSEDGVVFYDSYHKKI